MGKTYFGLFEVGGRLVLFGKTHNCWEKILLGKPMAYLGKTYFRGRSLSCIFIKTHDLVGKKNSLGKPMVVWEKPILTCWVALM